MMSLLGLLPELAEAGEAPHGFQQALVQAIEADAQHSKSDIRGRVWG